MTAVKSTARATALPPRFSGRIAIVRLEGFVDRPALEACDFMLSHGQENMRGAVVDLTAAQHLDYRAVDILAKRRRVLKARGMELAVAATHADVRHIIRAVAASAVQVFPTLEEATGWVRGESEQAVVTRARGQLRER